MDAKVAPPDLYYSESDLICVGAKHVGIGCKISKFVTFYEFRGSIGDNVRVDDWCVIKGDVSLSDYVHVSSFSIISGIRAPVIIREFVGMGSHLNILAGTDDYRANTLGNPCVRNELATMIKGPIDIGIGSVIGAHCLILPNVTIGDGASIGAGCIVNFNVPKGGMVRAATKPIAQQEARRQSHQGNGFAYLRRTRLLNGAGQQHRFRHNAQKSLRRR